MFLNKTKKTYSIVFVIAVVIFFSLLYIFILSDTVTIIENRNFIKKYGWEALNGNIVSERVILNYAYLEDDFSQMKVKASEAIGLNPYAYLGKPIKIYSYKTSKQGIYNDLMIGIWTYNNDIICAYIFHSESNIKINCWPLNADYNSIKNDLLQSKNSQL